MNLTPQEAPQPPEITINAKQMGEATGLTADRVMKLCDLGLVNYKRNGDRGMYRIPLSEAANFIAVDRADKARTSARSKQKTSSGYSRAGDRMSAKKVAALIERQNEHFDKLLNVMEKVVVMVGGLQTLVGRLAESQVAANERVVEVERLLDELTAPTTTSEHDERTDGNPTALHGIGG